MRKIPVMAFASLLFHICVFGQNTPQHIASTDVSAWAGLENALKPQPVYNLLKQPIVIEQDLAADQHFQDALGAFDKKDFANAAMHIRSGAQELLKEAPVDDHQIQRKLVEQRVGELFNLSMQVESGMIHDRELLQDQFADADESLAHRYYESTHTLIGGPPEVFSDRLMGLSVHLRNSKAYHNSAEKLQIGKAADDAASLAAEIGKMHTGERELTPALKTRLDQLMATVKTLKLDQ